MAVYINYLLILLCILVLVTVTVSARHSGYEPVDQPTEEECEKVVTHVETFVKMNTGYLKEQGRMLMNSTNGYNSGGNEVTELCLGIFLKSSETNYSSKLQGCVNIGQSDVMMLSYSDFNYDPCSDTDLRQLQVCLEPFHSKYILSKSTECTCPASVTSSTTPTQSTKQTTKTASLSTSTNSVSWETNYDKDKSPGYMATENNCKEAVIFDENFVKNSMNYLERQLSMFMDTLADYNSGDNTEVKEQCIGVFLKSTKPKYSIKLKGCFNSKQPYIMMLSYSDFKSDPCSENLQNRIEEIFSESNYLTNILSKPPKCTCPAYVTSSTTPTQSTTQTTRSTSSDRTAFSSYQPTQCTCPTCATPSTTPTQSTTQTTRTTTNKASQSTSTNSASIEPNSDKIQGACSENQGSCHHESGIIIGVTSFLAGVLVVLLFLWLLHIKRASQLCFRKSVKPPQAMTSDRATKKVLAKHMLSDRTDPPTQTNVLYFKNESEKKDLDPNTPEDEYAEIDNPNTSQDNYTGLKTSEVRSPVNDAASTEEHVYIGLQFDDKTDNKHPSGESDKTDGVLRGTDKTGSELFDRTRDSNISGHDYFVLQNENFRTSHQPDTGVSEDMNTINEEKNERPENTYFQLEKSPDR